MHYTSKYNQTLHAISQKYNSQKIIASGFRGESKNYFHSIKLETFLKARIPEIHLRNQKKRVKVLKAKWLFKRNLKSFDPFSDARWCGGRFADLGGRSGLSRRGCSGCSQAISSQFSSVGPWFLEGGIFSRQQQQSKKSTFSFHFPSKTMICQKCTKKVPKCTENVVILKVNQKLYLLRRKGPSESHKQKKEPNSRE